jgi:hypothetical protein
MSVLRIMSPGCVVVGAAAAADNEEVSPDWSLGAET